MSLFVTFLKEGLFNGWISGSGDRCPQTNERTIPGILSRIYCQLASFCLDPKFFSGVHFLNGFHQAFQVPKMEESSPT